MRPVSIRSVVGVLALLAAAPSSFAQYSVQSEGTPISTTVYVSFPEGSARFRPSEENESMLAGAGDAALVTIRGRTSTDKASARDEALALARATAARSYLIAHGVSPLKININYASAADFIADNTTADGRLLNQRVEIEVIHVPPQPEGSAAGRALAIRRKLEKERDLALLSRGTALVSR